MCVKRDQDDYKDRCMQAKFYSFSLVLNDKTLEFVSGDYVQFKFLTEGLEEVIKVAKKGNIQSKAKRIICAQNQ